MTESMFTDEEARILLLMIQRMNRPWTTVGVTLIKIGRRKVPETRNSRNPIKWVIAEVGCWMLDREHAKCVRLAKESQ